MISSDANANTTERRRRTPRGLSAAAASIKCRTLPFSQSLASTTTSSPAEPLSISSTHSGGSCQKKKVRHRNVHPKRSLSFSSSHSGGRCQIPSRSSSFETGDEGLLSLPTKDSRSFDEHTHSSSGFPPAHPSSDYVSQEFKASLRKPVGRTPSSDMIQLSNELTVDKLRFWMLELYGREKELKMLQDVVERAGNSSTTELVLVGGPSGVGKTSLATSIRHHVVRMGGAFVRGKFDPGQAAMDEPYSAILSACSELCCRLLALEVAKHCVSAEDVELNDEDYHDLTRTIPDLGAVVAPPSKNSIRNFENQGNKSPEIVKVDKTVVLQESKNRFHYLFQKFFQVVSLLLDGPLVILLDDLQWADHASLDLLEVLLIEPRMPTQHQPKNLTMLGLYR
jgi:AAA ATPase domain